MRSRKEMERMKPWMRKTFIGIVVLFLMALLAACGGTSQPQPVVVKVFVQQVEVLPNQAVVIYVSNGHYLAWYDYTAKDAAVTLKDTRPGHTKVDQEPALLKLPGKIYVETNTCKSTHIPVWETIVTEAVPAEAQVVDVTQVDKVVKQEATAKHVPPDRISPADIISTGNFC